MPGSLRPDSASHRLRADLDLQVLHGAQACLRKRKENKFPSLNEIRAWERFHQTYDPLVRDFVLACRLRGADVEDCLQEVWMEIVKKLARFKSDGSQSRFCFWLRCIVHSKATDLLRYRVRHAIKHLDLKTEAGLISRQADPATDYERSRVQEAVQMVLAVLRAQVSALSYRVFYSHWFDEHSISQIAAELDMTEPMVRGRLYKTKRRFRLLCELMAIRTD